MKYLFLLFIISSCSNNRVIYRNPSSVHKEARCKVYSDKILICKKMDYCYFDSPEYERETKVSCNFYHDNYY